MRSLAFLLALQRVLESLSVDPAEPSNLIRCFVFGSILYATILANGPLHSAMFTTPSVFSICPDFAFVFENYPLKMPMLFPAGSEKIANDPTPGIGVGCIIA